MAKKKHATDLLEDKEYHDFLEDVFQTAKSQMTQQELDMLEENGVDDLDSFLDSMSEVGIDRRTMMQALTDAAIAGEDGYEDVPVSPLDDPDWYDSYASSITKVFHDTKPQEFHLRVKLNNAPLKIWREFKVPSNLSLEALAFLLESVMGWEGSHLHQFRRKDTFYKSPADLEYDDEMLFPSRFLEYDANDFHLGNIFLEKGDRIMFEYDFGDSWEHDIWLKGVRDYGPEETPQFVLVKARVHPRIAEAFGAMLTCSISSPKNGGQVKKRKCSNGMASTKISTRMNMTLKTRLNSWKTFGQN